MLPTPGPTVTILGMRKMKPKTLSGFPVATPQQGPASQTSMADSVLSKGTDVWGHRRAQSW